MLNYHQYIGFLLHQLLKDEYFYLLKYLINVLMLFYVKVKYLLSKLQKLLLQHQNLLNHFQLNLKYLSLYNLVT
ncbi:hypothetical protein FNP_1900 [Fusobacterium polymorphum ATCC 10953]|uniref:Uncharacterized protein n=1 Tax=Fusobacterium polymorphum ATCC 10953 TaxID=393480 RepID=A5TXP6_FUSNP|nr:hypothetical protein FNP_1900 [Fusobacterium polymorphum ATCC 10953]